MRVKNIIVYRGDAIMTAPPGVKKTKKAQAAEQRKIDKCLNCTKPARECKGDCE